MNILRLDFKIFKAFLDA